VVGGVAGGATTHGVLPYPSEEDDRSWWAGLWSPDAPRIVLRLPFAGIGNARDRDTQALVIARIAPEPTGDDRSLMIIESRQETRRAGLADMLERAGLQARLVCASSDGTPQYLVEVGGFLDSGDERLGRLTEEPNVERVRIIGAYPVPLSETSTF